MNENNKTIVIVAILTLFSVLAWTMVFSFTYHDTIATDSCLYASIARNICRGNGFISDIITLNEINNLRGEHVQSALNHVLPFYPIVLSLFFLVLGATTKTVIISSGIFFILTIPLIYLIAKDFFGYKAGIVSSFLYIFTPQLLFNFNLSGLTEPFYTFLIILSFYIAYKSKTYKKIMLVGIVLGLSCMVRFNSFFFIIPFAIYIYIKNNNKNKTKIKIKSTLYLLAGLSIILVPHFITNYWLYDSPFIGLINMIHTESAGQIHHMPLLAYIGATLYKVIINTVDFKYILFGSSYFNPYLTTFFIISLLKISKGRETELFKGLFFVILLIQLFLAFSIFRKAFAIYRQLVPLVPIMLIFTSGFLVLTVEKLIVKKSALSYLLVLIISILIITSSYQYNRLLYKDRVSNEFLSFAELGKMVKTSTDKDDIIITNLTRQITWFSDRRTLDMPSSPHELKQMNKDNLLRNYVLIIDVDSKGWKKWQIIGQSWRRVMDRKRIDGYERSFYYENGKLRALLFKKESV